MNFQLKITKDTGQNLMWSKGQQKQKAHIQRTPATGILYHRTHKDIYEAPNEIRYENSKTEQATQGYKNH